MIETGVFFGNIHSFHDLGLVLAPFTPTPAKPKENFIDIPGGDGSLDLTEAHGEVKYNDREFTFTFSVMPGDTKTFDEKVTEVSNALNGLRCNITLDRDEAFFWEGRLRVDEFRQDRNLKQIVIAATVRPYKLKVVETVVAVELTAEAKEITLTNGRKRIVPEITCSDDDVTLIFEGGTYTLGAGTHKALAIRLHEGENVLKVAGAGTIEFRYREGEL